MKKALIFLSLLFVLTASLCALSSCGVVLNQAGLYEGFEYHVDSEYEITLTGYKGESTKLDIPSWIDGYKVVGIAFDKNDESLKNIESIRIPKTIHSLGPETFLPCTNLKQITVALDNNTYKYFHDALYTKDGKTLIYYPQAKEDTEFIVHKRVTKIEDYALAGARNLKSVTLNGTVEIGEFAFSGCANLEQINLGENGKLKIIGDGAFENCTALTSVNIPDCVEYVGASAFKGCTSVSEISVGSGVKYVGSYAFGNVEGYANVTEYEGAKYIGNANDPYVVFIKVLSTENDEYTVHPDTNVIYGSAFENCTKLKNIDLPNGLSCIGHRAFYDCTSLTSFEIPEFVGKVEEYTFYGCSSLKEVIIPSSVNEIGDFAFASCTAIEEIALSNRTKSLGHLVFSECSSLKSIEIPECLTYVGNSAFSGCSSLLGINLPSGLEFIGEMVFDRCLSLAYSEYEGAYYLGNAENPYLVLTRLKDNDITSYTVNENTKFICESAFYGSLKLTEVTIPKSVVSIGSSAFENCVSLEKITIPETVSYIGETAFAGCTKLSALTLEAPDYWITDDSEIDTAILSDPSAAADFVKAQDKFMIRVVPDDFLGEPENSENTEK